ATTLTLSAPAVGTMTVRWATADSTATAGVDYIAASGTATFAAGSSTPPFYCSINGHTMYQVDETFIVLLSNHVGITCGDNVAVVTIVNDDTTAPPTVTVAATDAAGAEQASDPLVFTVSRLGNVTGSTAVTLAWSGTATLGADYTASASGATLSA